MTLYTTELGLVMVVAGLFLFAFTDKVSEFLENLSNTIIFPSSIDYLGLLLAWAGGITIFVHQYTSYYLPQIFLWYSIIGVTLLVIPPLLRNILDLYGDLAVKHTFFARLFPWFPKSITKDSKLGIRRLVMTVQTVGIILVLIAAEMLL